MIALGKATNHGWTPALDVMGGWLLVSTKNSNNGNEGRAGTQLSILDSYVSDVSEIAKGK